MLVGALIAIVVGFLVSTMIWLLTMLLNLGRKEETGSAGDADAALAIAVALAARADRSNRKS